MPGIPLTHRDHAQSVRFVTAHTRRVARRPRLASARRRNGRRWRSTWAWRGLDDDPRRSWSQHGRGATRRSAIVENGSRADQRVTLSTLGELDDVARTGGIRSPALVIVGEVAALAARLHWFGDAPRTLGALSAAA